VRTEADVSSLFPVDGGTLDCAAIASELAAEHYGMEVLESNIEDDDSNFTRFLLLSRQSIRSVIFVFPRLVVRFDLSVLPASLSCKHLCCSSLIPPSIPAKTSIVFVTPNTAGALYKVGVMHTRWS